MAQHEVVREIDGRQVRFLVLVADGERTRAVDLVDRICNGMPGGVPVGDFSLNPAKSSGMLRDPSPERRGEDDRKE